MGAHRHWRSETSIGTGVRSAPRDALVAASVQEANRGRAFGLEGLGDNLGAFVGPLAAVFLLATFHVQLRAVFYIATVPGLLAVCMIALITERHVAVTAKSTLDVNIRRLPAPYWKYLLAMAVFGLGNSSNSFLILQTRDIGISPPTTS
jgi:MFS family permease